MLYAFVEACGFHSIIGGHGLRLFDGTFDFVFDGVDTRTKPTETLEDVAISNDVVLCVLSTAMRWVD